MGFKGSKVQILSSRPESQRKGTYGNVSPFFVVCARQPLRSPRFPPGAADTRPATVFPLSRSSCATRPRLPSPFLTAPGIFRRNARRFPIRPVVSRKNAVFPLALGRTASCRRPRGAFFNGKALQRTLPRPRREGCPLPRTGRAVLSLEFFPFGTSGASPHAACRSRKNAVFPLALGRTVSCRRLTSCFFSMPKRF